MPEQDAAASLDRLHDIVIPDPVPWWPPAPGWYGLAALVLVLGIVLAFRGWRRWKANAYRRQALGELERAEDSATIAALLRRVALNETSRGEIATLSGDAWLQWLAEHGPTRPTATVREQLTAGIYRQTPASDLTALRTWAASWIRFHRPARSTGENPTTA